MGSCNSISGNDLPQTWLELFRSLSLSQSNVDNLLAKFRKVEADDSGSVDTVKLLKSLDIEPTRFAGQIFTVFDSDGSGKVDFREFVVALWNYCTVNPASLDNFVFDLYDQDKRGVLTPGEINQMLKDIYGKNHVQDARVKLLDTELYKMNPKTTFNLHEIQKFAKAHQALLFPAFNLQHVIRKNILGEGTWRKASAHRAELCKGRYVTLADFLLTYLDKGVYERAVNASNFLRMTSNARMLVQPNAGANNSKQHGTSTPSAETVMLYAANEDLGNAFDYQSVDTNNDPSEVQLPSQGHSRGHSRHGSVSSTHSATENLYNTFASFSTAGSTSGHHAEHHGQPSKKGGATSANHKHGSLLMHTAAAADGEIHFNNSLKSKPVHATGHHMTDALGAQQRRKSIAPAN